MAIYNIAGVNVSMEPQHNLTITRANPFLTNDTQADISLSGGGDANEEYANLALSFYEQLLQFDGFLLHASAIEYNGKAIAFSAPSGTGKSTHSSYWRSELGAAIINDDKPAVRWMGTDFYVCGTPFSGKAGLSRNVRIPLGAIVFLTRSDSTIVRELQTDEALYRLLSQTLRPSAAERYDRLLGLLDVLLKNIRVFEAGVPNDPICASQVKSEIEM